MRANREEEGLFPLEEHSSSFHLNQWNHRTFQCTSGMGLAQHQHGDQQVLMLTCLAHKDDQYRS